MCSRLLYGSCPLIGETLPEENFFRLTAGKLLQGSGVFLKHGCRGGVADARRVKISDKFVDGLERG